MSLPPQKKKVTSKLTLESKTWRPFFVLFCFVFVFLFFCFCFFLFFLFFCFLLLHFSFSVVLRVEPKTSRTLDKDSIERRTLSPVLESPALILFCVYYAQSHECLCPTLVFPPLSRKLIW